MSVGGSRARSLAEGLTPHRRLVVGALVLLGLAAAFSHRFVQDDAYILYRYADHLARGLGLVWNPGEPVEGYSCFSFTVLLGLGVRLGLAPVALATGFGLAGFAATLLGSYALGRRLHGHWGWGAALVFLLATHPVALAWATGGMATSWQTALLVLGFLQLLRLGEPAVPRRLDLAGLSLLALLAVLTRPEGLLGAGVVLLAGAGVALGRPAGTRRIRAARLGWLLGPFGVGVGIFVLWKLRTYGDLVPTSVRAKAGGGSFYGQGAAFLWAFLRSTLLLWVLALVAAWAAWRGWRGRRGAAPVGADAAVEVGGAARATPRPGLMAHPWPWLIAGFLGLWLVALARVGGGFMEYRALAPVLPLGFALYLGFVRWAATGTAVRLALLLLLPLGGLHHRLAFQDAPYRGRVETVADLRDHVDAPGRGWVAVGRGLRAQLGDLQGLWIATSASGAIPFYSGLPTVDMLGLNDPRVARGPVWRDQSIGHRRAAPLAYLQERGVVLLLGHPRVVRRPAGAGFTAADRRAFVQHLPDPEQLPGRARLVRIPVGPRYALVVVQLRPHGDFDRRVGERGWATAPFFTAAAARPAARRAP